MHVVRLTKHKISDREAVKTCHATEVWMANMQNLSRGRARGSLHRLVRPGGVMRWMRTDTSADKGTPAGAPGLPPCDSPREPH